MAATPPQSPFLEPGKAAKGGEGPAQPPGPTACPPPGWGPAGQGTHRHPQADTRHGAGPEDLVGRHIADPRRATRAPSGPGGRLASPTRIPPPPRSPAAAAPTPATARVSAPPVCPRRLRAGSGCAGGDGGAAASAPHWRSGPARGRGPRWAAVGGEARGAPKPCPPCRRSLLPPCSVFTRNVEPHKHPTCPHGVQRSGRAPLEQEQEIKPFQTILFSQNLACVWTCQVLPYPKGKHFLANSFSCF